MPDVAVPSDHEFPPIQVLSKTQRRVLGVLIEKGITTPEYYPLTLKALTTGCNQKNNRAPLTEYSEDDVLRAVDQLRDMGLAAVVHTESGRTERYRHYVRKRFAFSEAQLAIMTELWLRGRQSVGDLRTRASRMHEIPSLEQLRDELKSLQTQGYLQANGPLDSRGVEVDHNFYKPDEGKTLVAGESSTPVINTSESGSGIFRKNAAVSLEPPAPAPVAATPAAESRIAALEHTLAELRGVNAELVQRLQSAEQNLTQLTDRLDALHRELGVSG